MCFSRREEKSTESISDRLLPDADQLAIIYNPSDLHLFHLLQTGHIAIPVESEEAGLESREERERVDFETVDAKSQSENFDLMVIEGFTSSASTPTTEVIDLESQKASDTSDSESLNLPTVESILGQYQPWSTGGNESAEFLTHNHNQSVQHPAQSYPGHRMAQNHSNIIPQMPQQCFRVIPCPQPIMASTGHPVNQQQHLLPYRLVSVEPIGYAQIPMAPVAVPPQSFGYYGPGQTHHSQTWQMPNGAIFGQMPQTYGPPQVPINPMPYYGDGGTQYFNNQPSSYYEGPQLVYQGNQSMPSGSSSGAYCSQSLTGLSAPSQSNPTLSQWNNQTKYNQVPQLSKNFRTPNSYATWMENSTGLDSISSETSEGPTDVNELPLSAVRVPDTDFNDLNPASWVRHPTDSLGLSVPQSPESRRSQSGSEFYSSLSSGSSDSMGLDSSIDSTSTDSGTSQDCGVDGDVEYQAKKLSGDTTSSSSGMSVGASSPYNREESRVRSRNPLRSKPLHMKNPSPQAVTLNASVRSPAYIIDRGTTFFMNGTELPYVINTWDPTAKMSRKPPNFEYYVPPMMEDGDFFGGQQHFWQMKMMQHFGKCRPDIWRLQAVPDFQKNPAEGWNAFTITTKLRFCCRNCKVPWTSKKGKLIFAFMLDCSSRRGWIFMKMFGQVCMQKDCEDYNFQTPACYPEEIDRATIKLFEYISYVCYGIPLDPFIFTECEKSIRIGNPKSHHRKEFCQACQQGICKMGG